MQIGVHKVAMAAPNDVSELAKLIDSGAVKASEIVALIGKTEGNGGANDFTRGYATSSYQTLLAKHLGISPDEVGQHIAFVWSGGTEGVLSPHATRVHALRRAGHGERAASRDGDRGHARHRAGRSRHDGAGARGRGGDAALPAATGITDPKDVHYVQVKGPLLTPASIADADRRGKNAAHARSERLEALCAWRDRARRGAGSRRSRRERRERRSGGETLRPLLFGRLDLGRRRTEELRSSAVRQFAERDRRPAYRPRRPEGCDRCRRRARCAQERRACVQRQSDRGGTKRIVAVFAKAEASPTGAIRGRRNTMLSDADINYERHARAAVGAVIASITLDPAIFVSGGTEHQCAPGAAPIAAIVRV